MVDWSGDRSGRSALRYWTRFMGAKDLRDNEQVRKTYLGED